MKNKFMLFSVLIFILSPILSLQETGAPSMPYVLAIILPTLLLSLFLKKYFFIKNNCYIISALFFLSALISSFISPIGIIDIRVVKLFLFISYFIVISSYKYNEHNVIVIFNSIIYLSIILCFLIILSYIYNYPHQSSEFYLGRYSIGITGLYKNPNYLTSFMNVGLFLMLYKLFYIKINKHRKLLILLFAVLFLISFYLTGTRASFVTLLISLSLLFAKNIYSKRRIYKGVIPILFLIVIIIFFSSSVESLIDLFLGNRSLLEDSGRSISWALAINQILDRPILGSGLFAWSNLYNSSTLEYLHNIFLELILNQGLIGLLLFMMLVFDKINHIHIDDKFIIYSVIIISGFPLFFQNGIVDVNFWRFIIFSRVLINFSISSEISINKLLEKKWKSQSLTQFNCLTPPNSWTKF